MSDIDQQRTELHQQLSEGAPRVPGWVKVFLVLAAVVLGVAAFALVGQSGGAGGHGPGRHLGAALVDRTAAA